MAPTSLAARPTTDATSASGSSDDVNAWAIRTTESICAAASRVGVASSADATTEATRAPNASQRCTSSSVKNPGAVVLLSSITVPIVARRQRSGTQSSDRD
eukprot:Amastigsp_a1878_7.p9 type:complete len:101 gc:universal Amastigsp_a1878_7:1295-993(-)